MRFGSAPDPNAMLQSALAHLNQRRFAEACRLLQPLARSLPRSADIRFLHGAALRHLGDAEGSERELRAAHAIDPRRADIVLELARLFLASGRPEEALAITEPMSAAPSEGILVERARAFQALHDADRRIATLERIVALFPTAVHHHNLAATLGDLGFAERSEAAATAALTLAGDIPESWLVLARALQSQNRLDEAEAAFRAAIRHRPDYVDALRDLSQLLWMREGDLAKARDVLRSANGGPASAPVRIIEARLLEIAGDPETAYALLAEATMPDPDLHMMASRLARRFDSGRALDHARAASALAPQSDAAERHLIEALIATGASDEALRRIEVLQARFPLDQSLIAAQWTAWKQQGDARADALYDYAAMVLSQPIDTPRGWTRLEDFLTDLSAAVEALHRLHTHPFDQSFRHGSQTSINLLRSADPAIRAFREAIDAPIRHYLRRLSQGPDRLRARNRFDYGFAGMWSVRLRPGGFHLDHTHPQGWLSSAFHIELPPAGPADEREAWLQFGQPGIETALQLPPGHFVEPQAGRLVLFPSYMWHGTVPFRAEGRRLSLAFDIVPA